MSFPQKSELGFLSLEKGLHTEANPLQSPPGTTRAELNMDVDITSLVRTRRKGFELVSDSIGYSGDLIEGYYWKRADLYVAVGRRVPDSTTGYAIYDIIFADSDFIETARYEVEILLGSETSVMLSTIRGRLVFSGGAAPIVFKKEEDGSLSAWYVKLFIRDFKLIDDGLEVSERPGTLDDEHKYNLYNAGWYQEQQLENSVGDPISDFNSRLSVYPSNADIVALGHISNSNGITIFNADELSTPITGNSAAPRGHYVYDSRAILRTSKLTSSGKDSDGAVNNTLSQILDSGTNVTNLASIRTPLIYREDATTGSPVDQNPGYDGPGGDPVFDPFPPGGGGGNVDFKDPL